MLQNWWNGTLLSANSLSNQVRNMMRNGGAVFHKIESKNHISQLMSTGRKIYLQMQMYVLIGQKVQLLQLWKTMMNTYYFKTIWGTVCNFFPTRSPKKWGIVWYGLKNATNLLQPVDAGFGKNLKLLVFQEQQDWLKFDENIELWLGNSGVNLTLSSDEFCVRNGLEPLLKR